MHATIRELEIFNSDNLHLNERNLLWETGSILWVLIMKGSYVFSVIILHLTVYYKIEDCRQSIIESVQNFGFYICRYIFLNSLCFLFFFFKHVGQKLLVLPNQVSLPDMQKA